MSLRFILSLLFIAGSLAAAVGQKALPSSPATSAFTVQLRDGRTINAVNLYYDPLFGHDEYGEDFSVYADIGSTNVFKDLKDIARVDVLDEDGTTLRLTFLSGEVIEGSRKPTWKKKEVVSDRLKGICGKLALDIPLKNIGSISREEKGE